MNTVSSKNRTLKSGQPPLDFGSLRLTPKPNQYLVAPDGFCPEAEPHRVAPEFPVSANKLRDAWLHVVARHPRVEVTGLDEAAKAYEFIQRTALLGFKDWISARFIPVAQNRSTLAVYSRSRTGYYDFGVNRERVETWLEELEGEIIR